MTHGLEWDTPLKYRKGGATFLDGIDVYFDFNWSAVCGHGRSQFRNGQSLARLARANCPDGKTPALLLTADDDVLEHPRTTDSHFFLVVNLPRYLAQATGNAAVSYYAGQLEAEIARMAALDEVASKPEVIEAVLTAERIAEWAMGDPARREQLRQALGEEDETPGTEIDIPALIAALGALEDLQFDSDSVAAIASLFGPAADRERRLELLRAVTDDPDGRYATGEVLAERTADRIADARGAMAAYQDLLDDPKTGETRMQEFIEKNLWLLGLDYAKMVAQQGLLTGTMDFILERFDGFQDVLELKDPQDSIITVKPQKRGSRAAPRPSAYALSADLAQALGQVHAYRDRLTRHAEATEDLLGLPLSRDPRLIIVIGRADRLPEHSQRVLTELNKSLHRVAVVPYDVLARRAGAVLDNVEKYLLVAQGQSAQSGDAAQA
jgi:hypothetical protein